MQKILLQYIFCIKTTETTTTTLQLFCRSLDCPGQWGEPVPEETPTHT